MKQQRTARKNVIAATRGNAVPGSARNSGSDHRRLQGLHKGLEEQFAFIQKLVADGRLLSALQTATELQRGLSRSGATSAMATIKVRLALLEIRMMLGESVIDELRSAREDVLSLRSIEVNARYQFDLVLALICDEDYFSLREMAESTPETLVNDLLGFAVGCLKDGQEGAAPIVKPAIPMTDSLAHSLAIASIGLLIFKHYEREGLNELAVEILKGLEKEAHSAPWSKSCISGDVMLALCEHYIAEDLLADAEGVVAQFGKNVDLGIPSLQASSLIAEGLIAVANQDFGTATRTLRRIDSSDTPVRKPTRLRALKVSLVVAAAQKNEQGALRAYLSLSSLTGDYDSPSVGPLQPLFRAVVSCMPYGKNPKKSLDQLDELVDSASLVWGAFSAEVLEGRLCAAITSLAAGDVARGRDRLTLIVEAIKFGAGPYPSRLIIEAENQLAATELMLGVVIEESMTACVATQGGEVDLVGATNLADSQLLQGQFSAALEIVENVELSPETHLGIHVDRFRLVAALAEYGADPGAHDAVRLLDEKSGVISPVHYSGLARYLLTIASILASKDEHKAARSIYRSLSSHLPVSDTQRLLEVELRMAASLEAAGDHYDAARHFSKIAGVVAKDAGSAPSLVFSVKFSEARNWCLNFNFERAEPLLGTLLVSLDQTSMLSERMNVLYWRGRSLEHLQRPEEAAECFIELLTLNESLVPMRDAEFIAGVRFRVGMCLEMGGHFAQAAEYYDSARSAYASVYGAADAETRRAEQRLNFCRIQLGSTDVVGTYDLMAWTLDAPPPAGGARL